MVVCPLVPIPATMLTLWLPPLRTHASSPLSAGYSLPSEYAPRWVPGAGWNATSRGSSKPPDAAATVRDVPNSGTHCGPGASYPVASHAGTSSRHSRTVETLGHRPATARRSVTVRVRNCTPASPSASRHTSEQGDHADHAPVSHGEAADGAPVDSAGTAGDPTDGAPVSAGAVSAGVSARIASTYPLMVASSASASSFEHE
mmetsp:Transcript_18055/g.35998  ORF Transcript_18055/g.35998 Transcript_18055/m.35998 type:complete len:202 (-) Transcript_18055:641-1246(-)